MSKPRARIMPRRPSSLNIIHAAYNLIVRFKMKYRDFMDHKWSYLNYEDIETVTNESSRKGADVTYIKAHVCVFLIRHTSTHGLYSDQDRIDVYVGYYKTVDRLNRHLGNWLKMVSIIGDTKFKDQYANWQRGHSVLTIFNNVILPAAILWRWTLEMFYLGSG